MLGLPRALAAGLALCAASAAAQAAAAFDRPQYLCLDNIGQWDPKDPSSFSQASVDLILARLGGARGSADGKRRLCLSFDFWVEYDADVPTMLQSIDALLALALANDLPLSVSIDATQWYSTRPDVWNWWDAQLPGFSPENRMNVEWSAFDPTNATSIAWRNWGTDPADPAASQVRLLSPAPNLASTAYRAAAAQAMAPVAARVAAWLAALPPERRSMLAYVRSVQELWQGTNFYWYPGANNPDGSLNWPPAADPADVALSAQIGFAAVCTMNIACGGPMTQAALDATVADFVGFAGGVLASAGVPRSRRMSHTGSFFGHAPAPGRLIFNSPMAAVTAAAAPGWSLYLGDTNASACAGLGAALDAVGGTPWGAPEFSPFFAGGSAADWAAGFEATMGFRNNRLVVLQNWLAVANYSPALEAIVAVLSASPGCLVDAAQALAAQRLNASAWRLSWAPGADAQALAVQAAFSPLLLPSGALAAPFASADLGGADAQLDLVVPADGAGAPVYWAVVSSGCAAGGSGAAQVVVSDVATFQ